MTCSKCSYLSDFTADVSSKTSGCELQYLNIASLRNTNSNTDSNSNSNSDDDIVLSTNIQLKQYQGLTIGFWVFANKMNSEYSLELDDILIVKLKDFTEQFKKNYDTFAITPVIYSLSGPTYYTNDSGYERWTHVKVGFHSDFTYKTTTSSNDDLDNNAFIDTVQYADGVPVYQKFDFLRKLSTFDYRSNKKIYEENTLFVFNIRNSASTGLNTNQVFIREIAVFNDYMRTNFED